MNVIAIETASPPGDIALITQGESPIFQQLKDARRTTETFATVIRSLLNEAKLSPRDIDLVATTDGPGSFTGLRIGVTAAKVFAYATNAKLLGVNTLELIATQSPHEGEVEAVVDAQRGELFAARFRKHKDSLEPLIATQIIHADEWIQSRCSGATLIGTGLKKIVSKLPNDAQVAEERLWRPSAVRLAELAIGKLSENCVTTAFDLVPQYYRKSAAEEKAEKSAE
jgi:tRNA threonylcarbamoyladenosine biosynthesis protein TsaB